MNEALVIFLYLCFFAFLYAATFLLATLEAYGMISFISRAEKRMRARRIKAVNSVVVKNITTKEQA